MRNDHSHTQVFLKGRLDVGETHFFPWRPGPLHSPPQPCARHSNTHLTDAEQVGHDGLARTRQGQGTKLGSPPASALTHHPPGTLVATGARW